MDSELGYEEWLETMREVFEALTTGGQKLYITTPNIQQWAGIHVGPGAEVEVNRTFTFRFEGPK